MTVFVATKTDALNLDVIMGTSISQVVSTAQRRGWFDDDNPNCLKEHFTIESLPLLNLTPFDIAGVQVSE